MGSDDDDDNALARRAAIHADLILKLSVDVAEGRGDAQAVSMLGTLGSAREILRALVDAIENSPTLKEWNKHFGDEKAALLKPQLQEMFRAAKKLKGLATRGEIERAFAADLRAELEEVDLPLTEKIEEEIRDKALAALLEGSTSPADAAVTATLLALRPHYQMTPGAVKEEALARFRERTGDSKIGSKIDDQALVKSARERLAAFNKVEALDRPRALDALLERLKTQQ